MMLVKLFFISTSIQAILFIPAFRLKTDKLTDFSYSLTFILLSLIALLASDGALYKILLFLMILVWGLRLGIYLVIRINKIKKDNRFDEIRINFFKFLNFWIFQGVVVFILLLPAFFFFQSEAKLSLPMILGFLIWLAGLLIETFADQQKFAFINDAKNKGKWVDVGLWKHSRHPNYLGEILCWVGIYIYTFNSLPGNFKLIGLLSPLTIITLLLFVSGIPKLEEKTDKKWGNSRGYIEYKTKTAKLIPFVY